MRQFVGHTIRHIIFEELCLHNKGDKMNNNMHTGIKEILRRYNLSSGISASIIPLSEAASRGISLDIEEPHDLASMIAGYDALFSTGLSKDYIDKREFNLFIFVYAFPEGMFNTFVDVSSLKDKKELIRRVSTHQEASLLFRMG
jgi:hypothetical protein